MKNKLIALARKLDSPASHLTICSLGAAVAGSAATVYYIKTRPHILDLSKEGYQALISGETNFVRFTSTKSEHAFRVTLENWQ